MTWGRLTGGDGRSTSRTPTPAYVSVLEDASRKMASDRAAPVASRRTPVEGAEENVGETLRHNFLPSLGGLDQL